MSFTCTVPPGVPSVLHSSRPLTPSSAENSSALFKTVKAFGAPKVVLLMPFTCTVLPATSVFHSSTAATPSLAEKYKALLNTVSPETRETAPTRTVPAASVFHSSAPATPPSSAEKYKALSNTMNPCGEESAVGLMFFTCTVPATSVFHSSKPVMPSSAEKYKALLNTLKPDGEESPIGLMSFTNTVPPGVPSLFHSSIPVMPSLAEKYKTLLKTVSPETRETAPTRTVPAPVPSVFHSSRPLRPPSAEKYRALPRTVNSRGEETTAVTRTVAPVPSLFHSSGPVPSSAEKNHAPLKKTNSEGKRPLPPGKEFPAPRLMSFTKLVPFAVPSVFHSSMPRPPSLAARSMMLGELALLAPPPHPASPNADASARALAALHNGPIRFSSRWIMAFYLLSAESPVWQAAEVVVHLPGLAARRPGDARALAGVLSGLDQRPVPRLQLA